MSENSIYDSLSVVYKNFVVETLKEASYLLYKKQPEKCPNWKEGFGDCNDPECEFCRIEECMKNFDKLCDHIILIHNIHENNAYYKTITRLFNIISGKRVFSNELNIKHIIELLYTINKSNLPMPEIFLLWDELSTTYQMWGIQFEYHNEQNYLEFECNDKISRFRAIKDQENDNYNKYPDGPNGIEITTEEMIQSIKDFLNLDFFNFMDKR